ncbi:TPA: hypothetical protein AB5F14_003208, partial [Vibrio cholerae]
MVNAIMFNTGLRIGSGLGFATYFHSRFNITYIMRTLRVLNLKKKIRKITDALRLSDLIWLYM